MQTLHLTDSEVDFIRARMQLAAMNEAGETAAMAEGILDLIAATKPHGATPRNMSDVMDLCLGGVRCRS